MASLGSIFVDLLLNTGKFESGLGKASGSLRGATTSWKRELNTVKGTFLDIRGVAASAINIFAAGLGANKLIGDLRSVAEEMDKVGKASDRLGITTESLSALSYAGKLAGVEFDEMTRAIGKMDQKLVDVVRNGDKTKLFQNLGLSAKELINLKPEEALAKLADGFQKIQNPALKAASYLELFGKNGAAMANLLKGGSKELQQMIADAKEIGAVFGREAATKAEEFNDSITTLTASYRAMMISFVSSGGLEKVIEFVRFLSRNMTDLVKVIEVLALVYTSKLIASLAGSIGLWVANTIQVVRYQAALGAMAGVTGVAATAQIGLAAVMGRLGAALGFIGGPIGLAALAVLGALAFHTSDANAASDEFAKTLEHVKDIQEQLTGVQAKNSEQLIKDKKAALEYAQAQLKIAEALAERYKWSTLMTSGAVSALNNVGVNAKNDNADTRLAKMKADFEQLQQQLTEMQTQSVKAVADSGISPGNDVVAEAIKQQQLIAESSIRIRMRENDTLLALSLKSNEDYLQTKIELQDQLDKLAIESAKKERDAVANDPSAFEKANTKILELEQSQADARAAIHAQLMQEINKQEEQLAQNINNSLVDNLAGFIDGTKTAKDAFKSFAQSVISDLSKIASKNLIQSLFGSFTGASGASGSIGGSIASIASSLFGGFFADGGILQPGQWGVAGENGAELIYGGNAGMTIIPQDGMGGTGNVYNIDARGADQGAVRRIEQALIMLAGPGVTENRVSNARVRGQL